MVLAEQCAKLSMKAMLADFSEFKLEATIHDLVAMGAARSNLQASAMDVWDLVRNQALCDKMYDTFKVC